MVGGTVPEPVGRTVSGATATTAPRAQGGAAGRAASSAVTEPPVFRRLSSGSKSTAAAVGHRWCQAPVDSCWSGGGGAQEAQPHPLRWPHRRRRNCAGAGCKGKRASQSEQDNSQERRAVAERALLSCAAPTSSAAEQPAALLHPSHGRRRCRLRVSTPPLTGALITAATAGLGKFGQDRGRNW